MSTMLSASTRMLASGLLIGAMSIGSALAQGTAPTPAPVPENDLLNATLWMSNSVEYQANALAIYQLAQIRLDQALADKTWSALDQTDAAEKPVAIVLDLDETVIDNDLYEAWLVKEKASFSSKTYNAWTKDQMAGAIPGAIEFLKYADSKGVKIFYVTNRAAAEEEDTRKNLEKLGAPMGGNVDTFLMNKEKPEWTSKKASRLAFVAKDHRVMLVLGDNYGDFTDDASGSEADREKSYQANKAKFGKSWLVLANPEYGSFESAPFGHDFSKPADARRQMKIDAMPAWKGPPAK